MKQKLLHQSLIVTLVTMLLALAGSSASAQTKYNFSIAGVEVTSANCSDLSNIPGVTGKVTYDPATKTLTLNNATINGGDKDGISSSAYINCVVKGDVNVTSDKGDALFFYNEATIFGGGKLTASSNDGAGIGVMGELTIEDCSVVASGKQGFCARDAYLNESLIINNAFVTAKGAEGSIYGFTNFTLEGCKITKPAGAVWNDSERAVCDASGNVITDEVVITPPVEEYGLKIAGVWVTSANCSDLTAIPGVKGKVTYDPATKTLTLEDASIDGGEDHPGIWSKDELTCVVKGEVSITSNNWHAMMFYKNAIIKGNGQLTLKSREGSGIYTEAALLIEGCTVYAEGVWGFIGNGGTSGESLTIRNASVTAKGTKGSICGLASFTLDGCEITKPAGAVWNDSKHAVCDASGNVIKDEVVISPKGGTAIDIVTPELQPAEGAIYDMNGVLRSEPLEELPTGVYIIGGHKVMHVQR